jgi:programmed cell death 6-interacting protein
MLSHGKCTHRTLRALNLPSSLEALEKPVGLPPSLIRKAEQVRLEEGPSRIEGSIEDVKRLAQWNTTLLDQVCVALRSAYVYILLLNFSPPGYGHP